MEANVLYSEVSFIRSVLMRGSIVGWHLILSTSQSTHHCKVSCFVSLANAMCFYAGQRTADAILEESFRVARDVARERMGGKKSSGVSSSINFFCCWKFVYISDFAMALVICIEEEKIHWFPSTGWWRQFWRREWRRRRRRRRKERRHRTDWQ